MKTISLALFTCLLLSVCADAKSKSKTKSRSGRGRSTAKATATTPKKVIDTAPADAEAPQALISTELGGRDVEFFMKAYEVGGLETWLGEQAKLRGEADKVKAVGDALQSTQAEENELLARLAKRKGVILPPGPAIAAGQKQMETQLAKLSGSGFDTAVMDQIGVVTQEAVDTYVVAAESKDADIQHFATQILPMVKEKLILAKKLSGKALPPGAKPGFRENAPPVPQ